MPRALERSLECHSLVVLDPGHGGRDPGAVANQLQEKDLTLTGARQVADILDDDYHVDIALTRSADEFLSLADRSAFANRSQADHSCQFISTAVEEKAMKTTSRRACPIAR
jgi:N-acetylmuramoyl-L-alanine amidase